jgi:type II secretory pathway component GspD/PulD (secretin)
LNNQPALIKVGTDTPFFFKTTSYIPGGTGTTITLEEEYPMLITVGTILSITPQISTNGWIIMDISPVLSSLVNSVTSPSKTITAPVLDIKQSSSLVRVRDGSTVILGGLINDSIKKC